MAELWRKDRVGLGGALLGQVRAGPQAAVRGWEGPGCFGRWNYGPVAASEPGAAERGDVGRPDVPASSLLSRALRTG